MKKKPNKKEKVIVMDIRTDFEKGFVGGLWYAVEQLVLWIDQPTFAEHIIKESCIPEWEFRDNLKQTGYEEKELTKFLNKVFKKHGQR